MVDHHFLPEIVTLDVISACLDKPMSCARSMLNLALGKTTSSQLLAPARRFTNTFGQLWLAFQAAKPCKSMRKDGKKWSNAWRML